MQFSIVSPVHRSLIFLGSVLLWTAVATEPFWAQAQRPMTFLDVQELARPGSWAPSPNGEWMLYAVSTPDWQEDASQVDIHLVSMFEGLASSRQMTFTIDKN
ncbi:MAG TPA: hypothetical protein DEU67_00150, partial [Acidobacteria bacterium]|nr:hypothetical protein [Acidobacteriota bacterium]